MFPAGYDEETSLSAAPPPLVQHRLTAKFSNNTSAAGLLCALWAAPQCFFWRIIVFVSLSGIYCLQHEPFYISVSAAFLSHFHSVLQEWVLIPQKCIRIFWTSSCHVSKSVCFWCLKSGHRLNRLSYFVLWLKNVSKNSNVGCWWVINETTEVVGR